MTTTRNQDPVTAAHLASGKTKAKASKVTPLGTMDRDLPSEDGDVSDEIRNLVQQEMDALRDAGFEIADIDQGLVYKAGTTLWDIGQANLKKYVAEAQRFPLIGDAAKAHTATIAQEQRKDHPIALADYRIDANGWFRRVEMTVATFASPSRPVFQKEGIPVSEVAFGQLRGFYDAFQKKQKAAERKKANEPKIKVILPITERDPGRPNINAWIGRLGTKQARMRARTVAGQREVFAFTGYSERSKLTYVPFDTDRLLEETAKLTPSGVRCEVKYDIEAARMRARCFLTAPIDIPSFNGVGRIHQIGFDLQAGDDGTMGIFVRPFVIRAACRNATLIQQQGVQHGFRHVGSFEGLKVAIMQAVSRAVNAITDVRAAWASAAGNYFLDEEGGKLDVEEAIRRLVYNEYIPTGGLLAEEAITNYIAAWKREEVYSAQGIIMAIQRAAHEGSWQTTWADADVEEAASELLYNRVYVLPSYVDPDADEDEVEV